MSEARITTCAAVETLPRNEATLLVQPLNGVYYPHNPLAHDFIDLVNTPFLTSEQVAMIRKLGFDVRIPDSRPLPAPPMRAAARG